MYKISTAEKKNVIETEKWKNANGEVITHITGWLWGSWTSSSKPNLEDYDEEVGCDPYELSDDMDLESLSLNDGCWEEWEYPESWDAAKITEFEDLWSEEWTEAPATWDFEKCGIETWIKGPIEVEETEDIQDDE